MAKAFRSNDEMELFRAACCSFGIHLNTPQVEKFKMLLEMLLDWNKRISLTAITEPSKIVIEHFVDSLAPIAHGLLSEGISIIDVGTGAGFPGLPIAIALPTAFVALLDASRKKMTFLSAVREGIGLTNVELCHGRAEELARRHEHR
ncbi:MAG: 16S rRNA (guanine(527)-N(7))-methyltransferase RsmG, partial [Armatimonadetes bacterium]|nr:16S rRNA (guanine(527)-N(7))-methyltransferase RsmG [Armatimonadota bacterium]